jgi:hypothetical protein
MSDEDGASMRCTGGWPKMRTTQNLTKCPLEAHEYGDWTNMAVSDHSASYMCWVVCELSALLL